MRLQRTIKQEITFDGIGLHTGNHVAVKLKPAPRDTGIIFQRTDKNVMVRASVFSVSDTAFATTLGSNGTRIKTVEHILAAAAGLGIDNLMIELSGSEVPILDGSSTGLIDIMLKAGIAKQGKKRPYIKILKPVILEDGNSEIAAFPYEGRKITFRIHFNHTLLGEQTMTIELNEENFVKELAPARTFGFMRDVEHLRANGLAKGGSYDNAVILGDEGVLNKTGLRFNNEFVRHKILDLIGDISLIGYPIYGHIVANKAGHSTNVKFVKKLLSATDCWEIISDVEAEYAHTAAYS
ncbi:MAG: UDP-3-O-acyl-N-acetylglucosamine deacetylase [Nitrospiraceae bacterium]|nr:UDP-3-O-acyl-N-acetylglucosamine deacetylase [Nitrospiraceae bacterium]